MKKLWQKGLSFILTLIMVAGLLPTTALAAVDSTGRPKDVNNALVLSIYTGTGFPGEPAVYSPSNYKNFDSSFKVKSGATFNTIYKGRTSLNKEIKRGYNEYVQALSEMLGSLSEQIAEKISGN